MFWAGFPHEHHSLTGISFKDLSYLCNYPQQRMQFSIKTLVLVLYQWIWLKYLTFPATSICEGSPVPNSYNDKAAQKTSSITINHFNLCGSLFTKQAFLLGFPRWWSIFLTAQVGFTWSSYWIRFRNAEQSKRWPATLAFPFAQPNKGNRKGSSFP